MAPRKASTRAAKGAATTTTTTTAVKTNGVTKKTAVAKAAAAPKATRKVPARAASTISKTASTSPEQPAPAPSKAKAAPKAAAKTAAPKKPAAATTKSASKAATKSEPKPRASRTTISKKPQVNGTSSAAATKAEPKRLKRKAHDEAAAAGEDKENDAGARPVKKARTAAKPKPRAVAKPAAAERPVRLSPPPEVINEAPTDVLSVFVFGSGECGELGLGQKCTEAKRPRFNPFLDPDDPAKLHVVQLACGGMHTIALTKDGKIVTWGVNDLGALGRDTKWDGGMRDAHDADVTSDSGSEAGEMNPYETTPTAIPTSSFTEGTIFVQVAAGDSCSFALTDTGDVYGWGTFLNSEGKASFGLNAHGTVIEKQLTPTKLPELSKITQITCGANHALAVDNKGRVWTWGIGEQNQLGHRQVGRRTGEGIKPRAAEVCGRAPAKFVASGSYHSFAVDIKDNVWAWGLNGYGQAGQADARGAPGEVSPAVLPYPMKITGLCGRGVQSIRGGQHFSAAVTADGRCMVWGRYDGGQLGFRLTDEQAADENLVVKDERDRPRVVKAPTELTLPGGDRAAAIACGSGHLLVVTREGRAFGAGLNATSQLGNGDDDDADELVPALSKFTRERQLTWAGAGGQFSILAAPAATDAKKTTGKEADTTATTTATTAPPGETAGLAKSSSPATILDKTGAAAANSTQAAVNGA